MQIVRLSILGTNVKGVEINYTWLSLTVTSSLVDAYLALPMESSPKVTAGVEAFYEIYDICYRAVQTDPSKSWAVLIGAIHIDKDEQVPPNEVWFTAGEKRSIVSFDRTVLGRF